MEMPLFKHDDFNVIRQDPRAGGFEHVKLKDARLVALNPGHVYFRKAVTMEAFDDAMLLKRSVMSTGSNGATFYPMYDHDGSKWMVLSLPKKDVHMMESVLRA